MRRLAAVALMLVSSVAVAQQPTPEQRLRADRAVLDSLHEERAELERRMNELKSTVHDLADEVENLDRQASVTARAVRALDKQLASIQADVEEVTGNLIRAEDELAIKRAMLRHRLVEIYKQGPQYTAQVLFQAESFAQLIARYKYLHLLALRDRALVARVETLRGRIGTQRLSLVSLQKTVEETRGEKANEEARLRDLESERAGRLAETKRAASETEARLAEIAKSEARLGSVISSIETARRKAASTSSTAAASASTISTHDLGRLDWPVEGRILYRFGRVVNPNNTTTRWNGIGIGANTGATVRAVAGGKVVVAQVIGTYGLTVIVQHGGGDYSVYGSLSRADVKKGQRVEKGDQIGAVGRSDPDLPSHLHFEIRRGQGAAVDPLDWLRGGKSK
ncbi:MAG TPA: peptidoglycan DD-metalloendopeptidase family protein [Gemmatimonadaceae bacterium]|jgi:septal ring factor EnvC (AmiA/AmiB activator)|nr:peptidoglycan DD-metalloendopeptidase family protein [Gemmatimonadaceae bacterium]